MRVVVYCRISQDVTGAGLGVARQEADCRELAAARGWEVVGVLVDNDVSAYSAKPRPGYVQLLAMIEGREVDAVVAWAPDRLHRSPRELEHFIDLVEGSGVQVATCRAGDIDLTTAAGRMTARVVGAVARHESEQKSERHKRKHAELAARGRWWGGLRPYGYRPVDSVLKIDAAEAKVVREAARRVLAGESTFSIASDLNRRGVPTVRGGPWRSNTLRQILTRPVHAGLRDGKPAGWQPIITPEQHARLRRVILTGQQTGRRPRSYLLTGGLARCGKCDGRLQAFQRTGKVRAYVCASGPDSGGCGGLSVTAETLEELVTRAVFVRADTIEMSELLAPGAAPTYEHDLAALEADLVQLAEDHASGLITRPEWLAMRARLRDRQEELERLAARVARQSVVVPFVGRGRLAVKWPELTLEQRRAVIGALVERVVVGPARVRGRRFDPERVSIEWRA